MELRSAMALANQLLQQHGLFSKGWRFKFDHAVSRFGSCNYTRKHVTLSHKLTALNDYDAVCNTILHEIAHALTPGHHHDSVWVAKAREIGCDGNRCYSSENVVVPSGNWIGECPNGHTYYRQKSPKEGRTQSCGKCSRRFDPSLAIKWRQNKK